MTKQLSGRTALVTGGGLGIGRAISIRLAQMGAEVVVLERSPEAGAEVVKAISEEDGSARCVQGDVAQEAEVKAVMEGLERLDILVNNAGIAHVGDVETTQPEDMDRLYEVNVKGVYHCLHYGMPKLLVRGGVVLNMASIAAKVGLADRFAYSMTKGAVLAMTLSVAKDYVKRGVRCNCICPARVHTPFVDGYLERNYPNEREEMFRKLSEFQPMGRMGKPEEIAALAGFLCSDEAAFITGVAYDIDGGLIAGAGA